MRLIASLIVIIILQTGNTKGIPVRMQQTVDDIVNVNVIQSY